MAPKKNTDKTKEIPLKIGKKDPTLPVQGKLPTTSKDPDDEVQEPLRTRLLRFIYNKETKEFCGRTATSWASIIAYSIFYTFFLLTYTLIFLFVILIIFKQTSYGLAEKTDLLTYSDRGIGLSATPTSEYSYPMIWYKMGDEKTYQKYVSAIDRLLVSRRSENTDYSNLGPCSKPPYGYGSEPCVIIRINRQLKWSGKPIQKNSSEAADAPKEVKEWLSTSEKLWLHCDGYHAYDKEHIGRIKYYPHPPGFDPSVYPLDVRNHTPLVAVQISEFAQGVSLAIKCNLWYENGPSSIEFMLYVEPSKSTSHFLVKSINN